MFRVEQSLGSERKLVADYVFLNVSDSTKSSWKKLKAGEEVRFEARIKDAVGVFLPVDLEVFPGDAEEVLSLVLEHASPLQKEI